MSAQHLPYFQILNYLKRDSQHYFDHGNKLMFSNKRINFTNNLVNLVVFFFNLGQDKIYILKTI